MTTLRILIPRVFDEPWDSVIIATYGADLEFFERVLLRQLSKTRYRVIFSDGRQVTRWLAESHGRTQLRQVNRTYVLAPVRAKGAAHAKMIMLLSQDRGLLAVGSGNLSMNGYASQGECFSRYSWSEDDQSQMGEFLAARSFIDQICEQTLVDPFVTDFVSQVWQDAPWLYGRVQDGDSRVRHNLERTLLDQFVDAIGGRTVNELVVHAPFYDHRCHALAGLIRRTSPRMIKMLLQERRTSVDPERLAVVLADSRARIDVRSADAEDAGTFLHAKFLIARCDDAAICLQGSPNISSSALIRTYAAGNIELVNLLVGDPSEFDHLTSSLDMSRAPVNVAQLGLSIASDGDDDETRLRLAVERLTWVTPTLSGYFDREVWVTPQLIIAGEPVAQVEWELDEPSGGKTRFAVTLGEKPADTLNRVAVVCFTFDNGEESTPTYPYHRNTLMALTSGQERTNLLKQAGDFELDDEELQELLAQLEEALVVDGRSIWRMIKRKVPEPSDHEETTASMIYEDLDWDAIQSHPKLAQYRNWDQPSSNPTALGILLTSIAQRFEAAGSPAHRGKLDSDRTVSPADPLDDLAQRIDAEDEEAAEEEERVHNRRRATTRSRAKRQFHSFVQRFVNGLTDETFVQNVGPSVIVPSYVIFNHLCWKLIQIDLANPLRLTHAQTSLWRFFWGDKRESGYFATLSTGEQEAALEILDRHHSEAVLLCSIFQAFKHTQNQQAEQPTIDVRDAWRTILTHPLFQPTPKAVDQAATQIQHECESGPHLINTLDRLAVSVAKAEPRSTISRILGCQLGQVVIRKGRVNRGPLGERVEDIYTIDNLDTRMTPHSASRSFSALAALDPEIGYIRLEDRSHNIIAFADYQRDTFLYANRVTNDDQDLDPPAIETPPWRVPLQTLHEMASTKVAIA
ncbi:MAG: hypothetical protein OXF41_11805 [bacterium]|nr:hypothetical protein [bacterium]